MEEVKRLRKERGDRGKWVGFEGVGHSIVIVV